MAGIDAADAHVSEQAITGLRENIESGYEAFIGDPYWRHDGCPPYVSLTSGGIKREGAAFPWWYSSPGLARFHFLRSFCSYALGRGKVLVWRELPSMVENESGGYSVYSRLVVVDRVGADA